MIVAPRNAEEWQALTGFLRHHAQVQPSVDMQCIAWVNEEQKLAIVVGFGGFMGSIAQIHTAYAEGWHFTPRSMLRAVFGYAFNDLKREMLLGIVNSKNVKAMRMDLHLGFREIFRLPGMHDDGGDIVILAMRKDECRYLDKSAPSVVIAAAGSA